MPTRVTEISQLQRPILPPLTLLFLNLITHIISLAAFLQTVVILRLRRNQELVSQLRHSLILLEAKVIALLHQVVLLTRDLVPVEPLPRVVRIL